MMERCRQNSGRFNKSHVFENLVASASISETEEDGAGTIDFQVNSPHWVVTPGKKPISWLSNAKCADGAIIEFTERGIKIHIVELKSSVGLKEWKKTKLQFEGMLLNIMGVLSIFGVRDEFAVSVYIAYKKENITAQRTASPYLVKTGVGIPVNAGDALDFSREFVDILDIKNVKLTKITRDIASGNARHVIA